MWQPWSRLFDKWILNLPVAPFLFSFHSPLRENQINGQWWNAPSVISYNLLLTVEHWAAPTMTGKMINDVVNGVYLIQTVPHGLQVTVYGTQLRAPAGHFLFNNRPFAAKPSRDLLFVKLWAATLRMPEMEKACRKHQNGQFLSPLH